MNLGEAKNRALKLMGQYSLDGIVNAKDKTADYLLTMNSSADQAQIDLARISKIEAVYEIFQDEGGEDTYYKYELPEDLIDIIEVKLDGKPFAEYQRETDKTITIKGNIPGKIEVFYYRFPTEILDDTPDYYTFEISLDAQQSISFFMAANAIMVDDPGLGTQLLNRYEDMKASLKRTRNRGPRRILDVRW